MILIGMVGRKGSGKTSAAEYLVAHYNFNRESFAGPLRKIAGELFGLKEIEFTDPDLKDRPHPLLQHTPRQILQIVGTDWVRSIDPYAWVRVLGNRIRRNYTPDSRIVIDDVRFQNEADWITYQGGVLLGVAVERGAEEQADADNHASETEAGTIHCDYAYWAPRGLPQLYQWLDQVMTDIAQVEGYTSLRVPSESATDILRQVAAVYEDVDYVPGGMQSIKE